MLILENADESPGEELIDYLEDYIHRTNMISENEKDGVTQITLKDIFPQLL